MENYLDNLKWMITGQTQPNIKSNQIKPNIKSNHTNPNQTNPSIDTTYDSESEFENVYTIDEPMEIDIKKINMEKNNLDVIKNEYKKIEMKLMEEEQLVRKRLNSDTIEQIKSNCVDYVNDDIKIIKDFALVMESFNHIKDKLIEFESGMKEFESDIKIKTTNQDLSNAELDNKINMIDQKLNNTIVMIDQINSTSNEVMDKIVKLENIINTHSTQREELLSKLNKVELTKPNCYGLWNKYLINFFDIGKYNFSNSTLIMLLGGNFIIGSWYIFKYKLHK